MCEQGIELRRKRDLERYHRRTAERREKGLCLKCGKVPPAPGRSRCEPCAAKKRPADRARHHRRTEARIAQGMCPKCGKRPPEPERSQCGPCREKDAAAGRARDARLRAAGMPLAARARNHAGGRGDQTRPPSLRPSPAATGSAALPPHDIGVTPIRQRHRERLHRFATFATIVRRAAATMPTMVVTRAPIAVMPMLPVA